MPLNNMSTFNKLTSAMGTRQIELTTTVRITVAITKRVAFDAPVIGHRHVPQLMLGKG
jgi:hypothetical protein